MQWSIRLALALLLAAGPLAWAAPAAPMTVFVSILPQRYFVERVGGDRVAVSVMVGPGQSPATYEPTPRQMAHLSEAQIYFRIGVPFEDVWMNRLTSSNPGMRVADAREGLQLREMRPATRASARHHHGAPDPHIWTSPRRVKTMAAQIKDVLSGLDPAHRAEFEANYQAFARDLDALDQEIRVLLAPVKSRRFMVFHPSWGYFADDYGLEQIAIAMEGKQPGARTLATLTERATAEGIRIIFVQAQYSRRDAQTLARAIGGRAIAVDPLAEDYLENLRAVARTFAEALG